MKTVMLLTLLGLFLPDTTAVSHSLQYFYTASSEVPNFPEFVAVGMLDDSQILYYDSNTKKAEPKQAWMDKINKVGTDYWESETRILKIKQQTFKASIDILKQNFNQTGGIHIWQNMYGCEWDDETGDIKGFYQFGYDGEDFVSLDLKTMTWVAPTPRAVITKQKWDNDNYKLAIDKNYFTKECVEWLKKYVGYGKSSLMRTDLPTVSLLQKSPSSRITCHATGFYPDRGAVMFWRKDGEELHEGVNQGEILPNPDGSFQMSADLELPSGDWEKYDCVFQLAGVKEDIVTRLEKREIKTNHVDNTMIIIGVAVGVLLLLALAGLGYMIYKKRAPKRPPSPASDFSVEQSMLPNPSS